MRCGPARHPGGAARARRPRPTGRLPGAACPARGGPPSSTCQPRGRPWHCQGARASGRLLGARACLRPRGPGPLRTPPAWRACHASRPMVAG
eukprot:7672563-Alexandrium_andersonii.AAC.1